MVIRTDKELYVSILRGIKKSKTGTIIPSEFNILINGVILNVVKGKLPLLEFNQKRIDDLEFLRVATDGVFYPEIVVGSDNLFVIPKTLTTTTDKMLMSEGYPLYLHGLNAMFKIGDTWKGATIMRSDTRAIVEKLAYRKPSAKNLQFELISGKIRFQADGILSPTQLRLEYIRYPRQIVYVDGEENALETSPTLNQEISEMAIRQSLEENKDPRYKSNLQEHALNSRGQ